MSSSLAKNLCALASDQAVSYKTDSGVELVRDSKPCLMCADYSWKNGFVGRFGMARVKVPCGGKRGSMDVSGFTGWGDIRKLTVVAVEVPGGGGMVDDEEWREAFDLIEKVEA